MQTGIHIFGSATLRTFAQVRDLLHSLMRPSDSPALDDADGPSLALQERWLALGTGGAFLPQPEGNERGVGGGVAVQRTVARVALRTDGLTVQPSTGAVLAAVIATLGLMGAAWRAMARLAQSD